MHLLVLSKMYKQLLSTTVIDYTFLKFLLLNFSIAHSLWISYSCMIKQKLLDTYVIGEFLSETGDKNIDHQYY